MLAKTFGRKVENIDYYDRVGAYGIIIADDKLATVKTHKGNFLLGGKIEEDESHEDCIKRECLEEIGCEVEVDKLVCKTESYLLHDKIGYFHPIGFYYLIRLKAKVEEPEEINHDLEWVSLDCIQERMYLQHQIWAVKQAVQNQDIRSKR